MKGRGGLRYLPDDMFDDELFLPIAMHHRAPASALITGNLIPSEGNRFKRTICLFKDTLVPVKSSFHLSFIASSQHFLLASF